jgi:hypothetical protein
LAGRRSTARGLPGLGLWAAFIVLLWPRAATGAGPPQRSVVAADVNAPAPQFDALVVALEDMVRHLDLRLRIERRTEFSPEPSGQDDVLAGVWIDASAPDHVAIVVSRPTGSTNRTYARSLTREGSAAVVAEQVAQVLRASLESILTDVPEEPAPATTNAPPPDAPGAPSPSTTIEPAAAPRPAGFGVDLLAFGRERATSAQSGPVLGLGAALAVSLPQPLRRFSVEASATYDPRYDVHNGPANDSVDGASFRIVPSVALVALEDLRVDLGVGGGVDLFEAAPLVVRASMAVFEAPVKTVDPVLTGQLVMRLRLAAQLGLFFGCAVDYDPAAGPTPVHTGHSSQPPPTFEPWRVRPAATFGLCIALLPGSACAKVR